jgi:hypothetical protein
MPRAQVLGPGSSVGGERCGGGVGDGGMRSLLHGDCGDIAIAARDVVGQRGGAGHRATVANRSGGEEGWLVLGNGHGDVGEW